MHVTGYRSARGPKAIAIHPVGILAVVTATASQFEAEEQALTQCNDDPSDPNRKFAGPVLPLRDR